MNAMTDTLITDNKILNKLSKAGKIAWPVMTNNSKGIKFKYVDEIPTIGDRFEHKGVKYRLKYASGCFYPFVYQIH